MDHMKISFMEDSPILAGDLLARMLTLGHFRVISYFFQKYISNLSKNAKNVMF